MTCDSELDCIEDNSGNNKGGERQTRGQRPFFTLTGLNNILLFQIEMNTWIASSSLKALVNFLDKATTLHKGKIIQTHTHRITISDNTGKFAFWCTLQ